MLGSNIRLHERNRLALRSKVEWGILSTAWARQYFVVVV